MGSFIIIFRSKQVFMVGKLIYNMEMKKIIVLLIILLLAGWFFFFKDKKEVVVPELVTEITIDTPDAEIYEVIGESVEGRDIHAFKFGEGEKTLAFVGALHGGYEWNSALLSYALIDYLKGKELPEDISVVVIPVANPDGLASVVGTSERFEVTDAPKFNYADELEVTDPVVAGRFNANGVDLNRNFACKWQESAIWRDNEVSAGSSEFSEPESKALRDFFLKETPVATVFYHSASDGVYASFCEGDPIASTLELLSVYSEASTYPTHEDYPYYEVTGDIADWMSTEGMAAVTVELETHDVTEWTKNLAGVEAMLSFYSQLE